MLICNCPIVRNQTFCVLAWPFLAFLFATVPFLFRQPLLWNILSVNDTLISRCSGVFRHKIICAPKNLISFYKKVHVEMASSEKFFKFFFNTN